MKKKKLSLKHQARKRLLRNLLSSLILFEKIVTREALAKAVKSEAEKLISKIKSSKNLADKAKLAQKYLYGGARQKLVDKGDSYESISFYRLNERKGDGAMRVLVQIEYKETGAASKKEKESETKDKEKK
jgi:ribosomal protein L17